MRRGGAGTRALRVREEYREMRYLMPDQIPVFLAACDRVDYADLAAAMALGGLRISEALALEPKDIDLQVGMIRVCRQIIEGTRSQLKDKTPRPVEIGPRLAHRPQRRIGWCQQHGYPMLFPDRDDGDYTDRRTIRKRWHIPALTDAGLVLEQLARVRELNTRALELEREIMLVVIRIAPSLLGIPGCGALTAAKIVGETAGVTRFRSKAAYARWNGTAPQPVWTGNTARYRLARTGNRQVNSALHRIAITQARRPTIGRDYYQRRIQQGNTTTEALRLLRRRLSDVVYRTLLPPTYPLQLDTGERGAEVRFRFVAAERAQFPVSLLCKTIGVTRQGFYAWQRRSPSRRSVEDAVLLERIRRIHQETNRAYGAPRIYLDLREDPHRGL